jgi:hypothetical protein
MGSIGGVDNRSLPFYAYTFSFGSCLVRGNSGYVNVPANMSAEPVETTYWRQAGSTILSQFAD